MTFIDGVDAAKMVDGQFGGGLAGFTSTLGVDGAAFDPMAGLDFAQ